MGWKLHRRLLGQIDLWHTPSSPKQPLYGHVPLSPRSSVLSPPVVATFSIVARDPRGGDLGVAVASKFLAVGSVVPWARAGAGAVATQADANVAFGPEGLRLMEAGRGAAETLAALVAADAQAATRQCGLVDARGGAAAHTGPDCFDWAGHEIGEGFTCQGNILAGPETVAAMATAWREGETLPFPDRLLAALARGEEAGGDRRGRQSAALLIVREGGGYGGGNDRWLDLRVDDHPTPVTELGRLLGLHRLYIPHDDTVATQPLTGAVLAQVAADLRTLGYLPAEGDPSPEEVAAALDRWAGVENLEERMREDRTIDELVLAFLRDRAAATWST
jgi:uncharacterized Ntn-hydrolase superfamily protein